MLKINFRSYISTFIFLGGGFLIPPVLSAELNEQTVSGGSFTLDLNTVAKSPNPNGIWGLATVTYKTKSKKASEAFTFVVQAPPVIKKIGFGLLSISEKNGGMNGTYSVTYLYPTDAGLTMIGGVEFDLDNGKYVAVNQFWPKWISRSDKIEMTNLTKSISTDRSNLIDSNAGQSLDNAMLFFAIPDLMSEIQKQDPLFARNYTELLSNEVDSSIANLMRRRFLGKNVSLCDSDQFDIFVCKLEKKTISVCSGEKNGAAIIEYRSGFDGKIELTLSKQVKTIDVGKKETESFESNGYEYTIKFGNDRDTGVAGIIVENKGKIVSRQQCQPETIEPYFISKK